jgi:predicted transcriptional regulator YdeE
MPRFAAAPQPADLPEFTVIGATARTTNAREMSGEDGKIGPLWNQYVNRGDKNIPGVIDPDITCAVYSSYESDANGAYDFTLGQTVRPGQKAPVGMKSIRFPAAHYLVFTAAAGSPEAIKAAWGDVYDYFASHTDRPRAFTIDFEQYTQSGVKLYIAVR